MSMASEVNQGSTFTFRIFSEPVSQLIRNSSNGSASNIISTERKGEMDSIVPVLQTKSHKLLSNLIQESPKYAILVVDDNVFNIMGLEKLLEK